MPNFTYNRDIPFETNNPSNDQPKMKINTNSTYDIINVDHYTFGVDLGGLHKQVRMPISNGVPGTIPIGLIANEGTLYTKVEPAAKPTTNEAALFYSPDNSAKEYQMTRTDTINYDTFGTFTNYPPAVANQNGGWTFLPGGLIMQYGSMVTTGIDTNVVFPIPFTQVFAVTPSIILPNVNIHWHMFSQSNTGFTMYLASGVAPFKWIAIGN